LGHSFGRVCEFFVAPPVTALLDQLPRCRQIIFRSARRTVGILVPRILWTWDVGLWTTKQSRAIEMNVGHEQFHRPAFGDLPGFVQIFLRAPGAGARAAEKAQPGAGEESVRNSRHVARAAEAVYGGVNVEEVRSQKSEVRTFQNRRVERGAAQREVVKREVEKRCAAHSFFPLERLRRAL